MSRDERTGSLRVGQLSVARRQAIARGWQHAPCQTVCVGQTATVAAKRRTPIAADTQPDAIRTFAHQVALATTGPVLRYSQRLHLLALANQAGISRFDANLIIAAIENHRAALCQLTESSAPADHAKLPHFRIVLIAGAVQAALVALTLAVLLL